jgi:hypothetical protein
VKGKHWFVLVQQGLPITSSNKPMDKGCFLSKMSCPRTLRKIKTESEIGIRIYSAQNLMNIKTEPGIGIYSAQNLMKIKIESGIGIYSAQNLMKIKIEPGIVIYTAHRS